MSASPVIPAPDGIRVALRRAPTSSRNAIDGLAVEADGSRILRMQLTAASEGGHANSTVIKLLAKMRKLLRDAFRIASGDTLRRKVIEIAGVTEELRAHLRKWMEMASYG